MRLFALLLVLAGCSGGQAAHQEPAPPADSASVARPAGLELKPATAEEILGALEGSKSKAVLVNVWATWCAPCRAEFPDLVRLHRDYRAKGLDLVLVSTDFDDQLAEAKAFLAENGVDFPTYLKVGDDMKFINTLNPRWTGALPATFIYDAKGRLHYFKEGRGTYEQFQKEVLEVLAPTTGSPKEDAS